MLLIPVILNWEIPFQNAHGCLPLFTLSTCSQFRAGLICLACSWQLVSTMARGMYTTGEPRSWRMASPVPAAQVLELSCACH